MNKRFTTDDQRREAYYFACRATQKAFDDARDSEWGSAEWDALTEAVRCERKCLAFLEPNANTMRPRPKLKRVEKQMENFAELLR